MNKTQRKEWEAIVEAAANSAFAMDNQYQQTIVAANTHILKLEREIHQLKSGKRIAAILKPQEKT